MPRNDQRRDRVASTDLNCAVVAPKDDTVTRLHDRHRHAMIRYVDGVLVRRAVACSAAANTTTLTTSHIAAAVVVALHVVLVHTSIVVLLLKVHVSGRHSGLVEGLTKMLLEVCTGNIEFSMIFGNWAKISKTTIAEIYFRESKIET